MRGKQPFGDDMADRGRSIPACAGETPRSRPPALRPGVYPRVCGGNILRQAVARDGRGLSPRVRGKQWQKPTKRRGPRSIPACAGETVLSSYPPRQPRVYPRVCGGNRAGKHLALAEEGLSPRVRGKHSAWDMTVYPAGSIPACAGETPTVLPIACCRGVYPRVCGGNSRLLNPSR